MGQEIKINQFHEILFWPNSIFLQFQKWPKIIFWTGKMFKTAKNAISWKKFFDLIDFTSFFAWTFLDFLARCVPQRLKINNFGGKNVDFLAAFWGKQFYFSKTWTFLEILTHCVWCGWHRIRLIFEILGKIFDCDFRFGNTSAVSTLSFSRIPKKIKKLFVVGHIFE